MPQKASNGGGARASKPAQHPGRKNKRESGLSVQQKIALARDFLEEDEDGPRTRRDLEEVDEVDAGELPEGYDDEEISSDEDDDAPPPPRPAPGQKPGRRVAEAEDDDDDDDDDDEQSIGSSVDEADLADLSTMLDDDAGDDAPPKRSARSNSDMLKAVGLSSSEKRRGRERVESREEGEFNADHRGDELTVDALLGGLGKEKGFGQLKRNLASLGEAKGKKAAARAQLSAPLERVDQRRVERQAATAAAHREVSGFDEAVRAAHDQEHVKFPAERPKAFGSSTGALGAFKAEGALEGGVEALLKQHGLEEGKAAKGEELAMANLSKEEVLKRTAELRKMRDLLFYHETKAKRISKIKSKSYRKVHKKAKARQEEREAALGSLDRHTAQKLALKREMERVQERMTLKHKNTSRWVKHALKQKNNAGLQQAVSEQLARGEELRRKQNDIGPAAGAGSDSDDESDDDDSEFDEEDDEEAAEGGGGRGGNKRAVGLLSKLRDEKEPELPETGLLAMPFMRKGVERRRQEAASMLAELEEQMRTSEANGEITGGGRQARVANGSDDDDDDDDDYDESASALRRKKDAAAAADAADDKLKRKQQRLAASASSGGARKLVGVEGGGAPLTKKQQRQQQLQLQQQEDGEGEGEGGDDDDDGEAAAAAAMINGAPRAARVRTPISLASALPTAPADADDDAADADDDDADDDDDDALEGEGAASEETLAHSAGTKKRRRGSSGGAGAGAAAAADKPAGAPSSSVDPFAMDGWGAEEEPSQLPRGNARASANFGARTSVQLPPMSDQQHAGPLVNGADAAADAADAAGAGVGKRGAGADAGGKKQRGGRDGLAAASAAAARAEAAAQEADDYAAEAGEDGNGDGGLLEGASLLLPTAAQHALLEEAFPDSGAAADFAAEKAALVESDAPPAEDSGAMPGWGSWGGMGAKPPRRAPPKRAAEDVRAELMAKAAASRKDAALRHVVISEKRDKKAAAFTTSGVPFPFKTREQFERSVRAPIGKEWTPSASHAAMTAPKVRIAKGAIIDPLADHKRSRPGDGKRNAKLQRTNKF